MATDRTWHKDRVGIFLNPHTRNRLNKLKSDLALRTGDTYSQDDIVKILLDHYDQTARKAIAERVPA